MERDWSEEVNDLKKTVDFLKLSSGSHKVEFLNEGEFREIEYEGKTYPKVFFRVKYNGSEYVWSVSKGITLASLYGQIALYGSAKGGLTGKTVTVLVKGEGKTKDYTIQEALGLEKQNNSPEEIVE